MRFAIVILGVLGCGTDTARDLVVVPDAADLPPVHPYSCSTQRSLDGRTIYSTCDGEHDQGRHLLGFAADTLAAGGIHVAIAANSIGVNAAREVTVGGVPVSLPRDFPAIGQPAMLRLESRVGSGYVVKYQMPGSSMWLPYCTNGEAAYPQEGVWTTTGLHNRPSPMRVTFGCRTQGKMGACEDWNYVPATTGTVLGPGERGWDLNQVCTQAAMANYCLDEQSHTREKTPIMIRDFIKNYGQPDWPTDRMDIVPSNYPPVPPPPDLYFVEALWEPRQTVKCLSKLRWNDQPPDGPCGPGSNLRDPRADSSFHFCEDTPLDLQWGDRGLVTASPTMDLALHRWNDGTGQTVTTVHGYVYTMPLVSHPPADYSVQVTTTTNEGFLLRNLTGIVSEGPDAGQATRVYRLANAHGDEIVAPLGTLSGQGYARTDPTLGDPGTDFEGYLLNSSSDQTLPFYLYTNEGGTDHITAAAVPPDYAPPPGYFRMHGVGPTGADELGYVIGRAP